jgi:hypothetical protein
MTISQMLYSKPFLRRLVTAADYARTLGREPVFEVYALPDGFLGYSSIIVGAEGKTWPFSTYHRGLVRGSTPRYSEYEIKTFGDDAHPSQGHLRFAGHFHRRLPDSLPSFGIASLTDHLLTTGLSKYREKDGMRKTADRFADRLKMEMPLQHFLNGVQYLFDCHDLEFDEMTGAWTSLGGNLSLDEVAA